ncbi:MAG: Rod shape-determining protein MreD [Bacteroidetes bacterium]|nr:MAG: Rod shape-determining protein MreD [Bacteroidota bacterium]
MGANKFITQAIGFLVYLVLQVFFLHNITLFNKAFCFVYIAFILLIPVNLSTILVMLIAFCFGMITDFSYNISGIHTAACVLLAFVRKPVLDYLKPNIGYESGVSPTLPAMGKAWFAKYSLFLIFIHHLALFTIEAGVSQLFSTVVKIISSTAFTFAIIYLFQVIFYKKQHSR